MTLLTISNINMKYEISIIILILSVLFLGACDHEIDDSLGSAGKNRIELEKVLLYFEKKDAPLRYRAAKFLIQNMVYHYSMYGNGAEKINNTYINMAKNAKEFRDSIYKSEMQNSDSMRLQIIPDNMQIKSSFLIKAINDACDIWEKTKEYAGIKKEDFFRYFDKKQVAFALQIGNVRKYQESIDPYTKYKHFSPPQSFCYVTES